MYVCNISQRCSNVYITIFARRKDKTNYLSNQIWAKCYHSRNKYLLKKKTLDGGSYIFCICFTTSFQLLIYAFIFSDDFVTILTILTIFTSTNIWRFDALVIWQLCWHHIHKWCHLHGNCGKTYYNFLSLSLCVFSWFYFHFFL